MKTNQAVQFVFLALVAGLLALGAPKPAFAGLHTFAGLTLILNFGPHIGGFGETPLMVPDPTPGWRQLISAVDALAIAQSSSFARPDLSDPTQ